MATVLTGVGQERRRTRQEIDQEYKDAEKRVAAAAARAGGRGRAI